MTAGSPEFELLAACGCWPRTDTGVARIRAMVAAGFDQERFLRLCHRHRMAGMAADAFRASGLDVPEALRDAARDDLMLALRLTAEALRLIDLLAEHGVDASVLKGPALAQQLFGTLAVRQMRDLDLLTDPLHLGRAIDLLKREGYVPTNAGNDDALRPDRAPMFKDVEFRHPTSGMVVEVHGRLGENDALLPVASLDPPEPVEVMPNRTVQALTGASQLRYLMMHGFRHGWMRLKWLVDVATILNDMERPARDAFLVDMRRRQLGAVSDSTVLLVQRVFPGSSAMIDEARASRRARWCAAIGERYLRDEREGEQQVTTRLLVTGSRLLGSSRPGYLAREVARLLIDSGVVLSLGGGRGAITVSMLLRPVALPFRVIRNSLRARR